MPEMAADVVLAVEHTNNADYVCPKAPLSARPFHRFIFDTGDVADAECVYGCGTTWKQMLGGNQ